MTAAAITPTARLAANATDSAAVSGADRPIAVEPSSSSRPDSSSARVCRVTSSTTMTPSSSPTKPMTRQAVRAPRVCVS